LGDTVQKMKFPLFLRNYIAWEIMTEVKRIGYCDGNLGMLQDVIVRQRGGEALNILIRIQKIKSYEERTNIQKCDIIVYYNQLLVIVLFL